MRWRIDRGGRWQTLRSHAALLVLLLMLVLPEFVLLGSDHLLWGFPDWRLEAYRLGAF